MLEKTLESPLDCKEIQPVHSKGDQSWLFFGRTDTKAETPVVWPPHAKSWLIGKDPDAGRDWGQEEKGTTEDEMAGWHHQLDGHEFGWTLGVGDGQGSLACCNSWGHKVSDTTEWLNWTEWAFMYKNTKLNSMYGYFFDNIPRHEMFDLKLFLCFWCVPKFPKKSISVNLQFHQWFLRRPRTHSTVKSTVKSTKSSLLKHFLIFTLSPIVLEVLIGWGVKSMRSTSFKMTTTKMLSEVR